VVKPNISLGLGKLSRILHSSEIGLVLLQDLEEELTFVRGLANESVESSKTSVQHLDLFHTDG